MNIPKNELSSKYQAILLKESFGLNFTVEAGTKFNKNWTFQNTGTE